jgi:hypothetical protein
MLFQFESLTACFSVRHGLGLNGNFDPSIDRFFSDLNTMDSIASLKFLNTRTPFTKLLDELRNDGKN